MKQTVINGIRCSKMKKQFPLFRFHKLSIGYFTQAIAIEKQSKKKGLLTVHDNLRKKC